jgi:hypothetical protein
MKGFIEEYSWMGVPIIHLVGRSRIAKRRRAPRPPMITDSIARSALPRLYNLWDGRRDTTVSSSVMPSIAVGIISVNEWAIRIPIRKQPSRRGPESIGIWNPTASAERARPAWGNPEKTAARVFGCRPGTSPANAPKREPSRAVMEQQASSKRTSVIRPW